MESTNGEPVQVPPVTTQCITPIASVVLTKVNGTQNPKIIVTGDFLQFVYIWQEVFGHKTHFVTELG